MNVTIALAGNPNCGKTTMFNELTGSSQYVGNWPGVTVEKKEGKLRGNRDVIITDLPGIYSLSPYTLEEVVSRNYLLKERPDAIINLVDGTNLERNLYLTTQVVELGIPVVIALNMMDIVNRSGDKIDVQKLGASLGCDIVETSALKGTGLDAATGLAIKAAEQKTGTRSLHSFGKPVEAALGQIAGLISGGVPEEQLRWYAIKLFERDQEAKKNIRLSAEIEKKIEDITVHCEKALDDDSESIITNERYNYITELVKGCLRKKRSGMTVSDKIDRVVTNRWLALPIFAVIMWVVYYVSVSSLGAIVTDWTNDTLFGGWITDLATSALEAAGTAGWLTGLIVDGIIGGVGTVLGFVPQMFILFFFMSLLEDSGYMARVAFIMDRVFRKFGLSGKSFIPMLISSGCGVPGIMATRTIENEKDRRMTMMVTTFIPCGAKTVIIGMIAATFFRGSVWVAPAMYFLGILMVIFSGIVLKKTRIFAGDPAPFVMELPQYHIPSPKGVLIHMWERGKAFIIKAGTIIFIACGIIWFFSNFNWSLQLVDDTNNSMLASIGSVIAPIFAPLGFGTWQGAVATISALAAKENAIGTFGVLFGLGDVGGDDPSLIAGIGTMFTAVSGLSFMIFNLFNPPCFAAIGATRREMASLKWTFIAIGYQTILGYALAFIVNQFGGALFLGTGFGVGPLLAAILCLFMLWLLLRRYNPRESKIAVKSQASA